MTFNRGYGAETAVSVIDAGSYFNGVYRSPGDLRVEGEFEGEIQCEGRLTVAETARVSGKVAAGSVSVSGQLQGDVDCAARFELLASGQVSATVISGTIVVREGAFYEGQLRMRVAPEGLPERELTRAAEVQAPVEAAPVQPGVNGREHSDAPIHAVSD